MTGGGWGMTETHIATLIVTVLMNMTVSTRSHLHQLTPRKYRGETFQCKVKIQNSHGDQILDLIMINQITIHVYHLVHLVCNHVTMALNPTIKLSPEPRVTSTVTSGPTLVITQPFRMSLPLF